MSIPPLRHFAPLVTHRAKGDFLREHMSQPVGRPSDYRPEYCQQVQELGKLGKSVAQIAGTLEVSKQTVYDWMKVHPEFLDAMQKAKDFSQKWWEDMGQEGLVNLRLNAALWTKQVTCRFRDDYSDVQAIELTGRNGGPVETKSVSETDQEIINRYYETKGAKE